MATVALGVREVGAEEEMITYPDLAPCQHEGCDRPGMYCTNLAAFEEEWGPEFYCSEHAPQHGYCQACGDFWGGISSFEATGFCDHCWSEWSDDGWDYDDETDGDYS